MGIDRPFTRGSMATPRRTLLILLGSIVPLTLLIALAIPLLRNADAVRTPIGTDLHNPLTTPHAAPAIYPNAPPPRTTPRPPPAPHHSAAQTPPPCPARRQRPAPRVRSPPPHAAPTRPPTTPFAPPQPHTVRGAS